MKTSNTYNTKQRNLILNCLIKNRDKHITADEIMTFISKEKVGKTTIYRYLDKLVSQGLVRKFIFPKGTSACYQYIDNSESCYEHYHLKCLDCGQLIHFECKYLDDINNHILNNHDFNVDHSKTVFYGQCGICKSK